MKKVEKKRKNMLTSRFSVRPHLNQDVTPHDREHYSAPIARGASVSSNIGREYGVRYGSKAVSSRH
jgi:hypothetical protein